METLREFLVKEWGEEVLSSEELITACADMDYDKRVTAKYRADDSSTLVVAGDSAIISAPANIVVMSADDIDDDFLNDGGWHA